MASFKIPENEYNSAKTAIEKILDTDIEDIEITDTLPLLDSLEDSNKVFKGNLSILFVDMRKSSDITEELGSKEMAKIYRSFIRIIIQSIRYSGGHSRQFAGDGIMGVFQDDYEDDGEIEITSSQKAIKAGRYISTLIDHCLNPVLQEYHDDLIIGYGIGIGTGEIMITKAGMRGREGDETVENEVGIIWVGSTTNYASKLCDLCEGGELFIDDETYSNIYNFDNVWEKVSKIKGTKTYEGYLTKNYYLELPEKINVDPLTSDEENIKTQQTFIQEIFEETKKEASELIDEIIEKSTELANKLNEIKSREKDLNEKERQITKRETEAINFENNNYKLKNELDTQMKSLYYDYKNIFSSTFLRKDLILTLEIDFWEKLLEDTIEVGKKIGKAEIETKTNLSHDIMRIYYYFEMYDKAYDSLCFIAEYSSWISESEIKDVLENINLKSRLEEILKKRIYESDTDAFEKALNKLKEMKK